jgi:hypothetical protein
MHHLIVKRFAAILALSLVAACILFALLTGVI